MVGYKLDYDELQLTGCLKMLAASHRRLNAYFMRGKFIITKMLYITLMALTRKRVISIKHFMSDLCIAVNLQKY